MRGRRGEGVRGRRGEGVRGRRGEGAKRRRSERPGSGRGSLTSGRVVARNTVERDRWERNGRTYPSTLSVRVPAGVNKQTNKQTN